MDKPHLVADFRIYFIKLPLLPMLGCVDTTVNAMVNRHCKDSPTKLPYQILQGTGDTNVRLYYLLSLLRFCGNSAVMSAPNVLLKDELYTSTLWTLWTVQTDVDNLDTHWSWRRPNAKDLVSQIKDNEPRANIIYQISKSFLENWRKRSQKGAKTKRNCCFYDLLLILRY